MTQQELGRWNSASVCAAWWEKPAANCASPKQGYLHPWHQGVPSSQGKGQASLPGDVGGDECSVGWRDLGLTNLEKG